MNHQETLFPECHHQETIEVLERGRSPHYARRVCKHCNRFLGWIPKPETLLKQLENSHILSQLAKRDLTEWERHFISGLVTHKNISPRQQGQLHMLRDKYLKEA